MITEAVIAYFSMEIALENGIPTYSGGLGVLAGDTLRAAADLGVSMVGVTLLHREGHFTQRLDADGTQREEPVAWSITDRLESTDGVCSVQVEGRDVRVRAWRYLIRGVTGDTVPVFLIDTDIPGNEPDHRRLTDRLYGGNARYRLCQELILGAGGVRMLRTLGYTSVARYHMNEGHAALLALELLGEEEAHTGELPHEAIEAVKRRCVFNHGEQLTPDVRIAYLPDYDLELARDVVAGVDLCLNTPRPPLEASGTSGMKAAHNGVPSLSILDGWWLDGHVEGITGWSIGRRDGPSAATDEDDAKHLYEALEHTILPLYTDRPAAWAEVMRLTIALNASFFNAQRMLQEYMIHAYQGNHAAAGP